MIENVVSIKQLSFSQDNGKLVFKDLNLLVPKGKITAILGPSGTGKTTLLRLIGGQVMPNQGEINVLGNDLSLCSNHSLYQLRKRMGMLFQGGGLFTHLTVFENVAFPLREHTNLNEGMIRTLVLLKLQMVGLRGAATLYPAELSGGMARRVALARAVALDPELIMYDEPFTGQDPISLGVLASLIHTLNHALSLTSIIVSHDVEETLKIADHVYLLADGAIVAEGSPQAIASHTNARVQQFIHGEPDGPQTFDYAAVPIQQDFLENRP